MRCGDMNLAWNLTETDRLTLYYDSVEELGRLACSQCLFFALSRRHFRIECIAFTLSYERKLKSDKSLIGSR